MKYEATNRERKRLEALEQLNDYNHRRSYKRELA
jgi:hypothetical protein